mgnify:CR=1 FL=1
MGTEVLKAKKKAWILSYWQIVIERLPALGERITAGTFATEFKGLYGNRNFVLDDARGNRLAYANSVWVFMDMEKGRPARPEPEDVLPYGSEPALEMEYEDRKIRLPENLEEKPSFPVRKYHIDTNEHVNNCQYVQMALEVFAGRDKSPPDPGGIQEISSSWRCDLSESGKRGKSYCDRIVR